MVEAKLTQMLLADAEGGRSVVVEHVSTLEQAILALEEQHFDCVVLDLGLPDGCGIDAVMALCNVAPEVTIVVLTGLDDDSVAFDAIKMGAQEYAVKGQFDGAGILRIIRHAVERHRLMTELNRQREQEYFFATHDVLTGLPNRQLLRDQAKKHLAAAARHQQKLALVFLDLDGFKGVNDQYGHSAGDRLLKEVATVMLAHTREEDTVARVGGDEFVMLLPNIDGIAEVTPLVKRVVNGVSQIKQIVGQPVSFGVTAGVAFFPKHGQNFQALRDAADTAMYAGKKSGRSIVSFDPELHGAKVSQTVKNAVSKKSSGRAE